MHLKDLMSQKPKTLSKEKLAEILQTNPAALDAFEKAYSIASLNQDELTGYKNAKTAGASVMQSSANNTDLIETIATELLAQTKTWTYQGKQTHTKDYTALPDHENTADIASLNQLPLEQRPFLTGNAVVRHIQDDAYPHLLNNLKCMQEADNPHTKKMFYMQFRRGLDILDLDPVMYEMLGCNKNAMGYWLPRITDAVDAEGFFHIPNTTIAKVPLPILQLTRMDYMNLNRTTLDIVNRWAMHAFGLQTDKQYFIKTGTYSSKFDFRNAKVTDPNEIAEIGEYLLFIHNSATMLPFYGVSTTNEWVVREFIKDEDHEVTIYHGLPLHTEYRVFVDFDTNEVFGVHNYWDPDVMTERFSKHKDADTPDMIHDFITYTSQEKKLTKRFLENKDMIAEHIQKILPNIDLKGQWSIDVMQNGDKFWIIDMALAEQSAFYEQEIPESKRVKTEENWIPQIPDLTK